MRLRTSTEFKAAQIFGQAYPVSIWPGTARAAVCRFAAAKAHVTILNLASLSCIKTLAG